MFRLFTTENNNSYIYIPSKQYLLLVSDIVKWILCNAFENNVFNERICYDSAYIRENYSIEMINESVSFVKFLDQNIFSICDTKEDVVPMHIGPVNVMDNFASSNDLVLEVTEDCNLNCEYCIYGDLYNHTNRRSKKRMRFEVAKTIIDYKVNLWESGYNNSVNITKLIGFYGGEPLLNIDLIKKVVKYTKNIGKTNGMKFRYNIVTNGILLHKYIDFLVKNDFILTISLDGDEYHNQYRVFKNKTQSFNIVVDNIFKIQSQYPDYFKRNVNFNTVIHNKSNIKEIYKFFNSKFQKNPFITEVNTNTSNTNISKYTYNQPYEQSHSHKYYLKNDASDFFIDNVFTTHNSLFINKNKNKKCIYKSGTCVPFSKKVFVTVDGSIMMCEKVSSKFSVGRVCDGEVYLDYNKAAQLFNELIDKRLKTCCNCYLKSICSECIFALEDYECPSYADLQKYKEKLVSFTHSYELVNEYDGYIIYFYQFVYISINSSNILLYNELNRKYLIIDKKQNEYFYSVLYRLTLIDDERQYVKVGREEFRTEECGELIELLRSGFWGDVYQCSGSIPFIRMPGVHIINDVEFMHVDDEYLIGYKLKLSIFELNINLGGYYNITHRSTSYKVSEENRQVYLFLDKIAKQCEEYRYLRQINLYINSSVDVATLKSFINIVSKTTRVCIHIDIDDIKLIYKSLCVNNCFVYISPTEHDYVQFKKNIQPHFNHVFCLVKVSTVEEYQRKIELDTIHGLITCPYPIIKAHKIDKEIWKRQIDQILSTHLSIQDIFINKILNKNLFGKIFIDEDGSITSMDDISSKTYNISKNSLVDFVYDQLKLKKGWYKTRCSVPICEHCIFNNICPPVSVTENDYSIYSLCNKHD